MQYKCDMRNICSSCIQGTGRIFFNYEDNCFLQSYYPNHFTCTVGVITRSQWKTFFVNNVSINNWNPWIGNWNMAFFGDTEPSHLKQLSKALTWKSAVFSEIRMSAIVYILFEYYHPNKSPHTHSLALNQHSVLPLTVMWVPKRGLWDRLE